MFSKSLQMQVISPNWKEKYYHWLICFLGLVTLIIVNGLTTTSLSVFDKAFLNEFHWQREELKLRESITNGVTFFFIFISGMIIDRIRVKKMLLFGSLVLSIALLGYSFIENRIQVYLVHLLLGIALITAGSIPCVILVSTWFQDKKGLAIGILLTGTSLGSALFSLFNGYLLREFGWRIAFQILAIFPTILFFIILIFIRSTPIEIGLNPFQTNRQSDNIESSDLLNQGLSYLEATKTHLFWLICVCGFFTFYSLVGIIANLFLHLTGLGFSEKEAGYFLFLYFVIAFIGKLLISTFTDYFKPYFVFSICCIGMIIGCLGLALMDKNYILISIIIMALSWGGIYSLYNLLTVKIFGLKAAGKINGTISMFEGGGALIGPFLMGYIFSCNQSYQLGFFINAVLMGLVFFFSLKFKSYIKKINDTI